MIKKIKEKFKRGFTLMELLIVIAIIGILSATVLFFVTSAKERARDAERISNVTEIGKALEMYKADHQSYPVSVNSDWMGSLPAWGSYDITGENGYIPSLAPTYIPVLPTDPRQADNNGYMYKSNGEDYFFMAHGTAEKTVPETFRRPSNPESPDIVIYTPGYAEATVAEVSEISGITISGSVTYKNAAQSQLLNVTVYLKQGGVTKYSATTPATGSANYSLLNVIPGTYDVYFSLPTADGSVNASDAAQLNTWISSRNFGGIRVLAGDAYENSPNVTIDANDVSAIQQYYIYGIWNSDPGAFVFTKSENQDTAYTSFPIPYARANSAPLYSSITITVGDSNITQNFKGLAYGDINMSYVFSSPPPADPFR